MSRALPILLLTALAACAANPRPGEPGYPYNVDGAYKTMFVVDGSTYTGTLEATTAPGGTVTGTVSLAGEVTVTATFSGAVVGDSLTWSGLYTLAEVDCPGTVSARGLVGEGGGSLSGEVHVEACDSVMEGTYTASR